MIDTLLDLQQSTRSTIQGILRSLLTSGTVDALLVPLRSPAGAVAPSLLTDPDALNLADPLAPVLPINAARAAAQLTATSHPHKLGLVLRSCEIRALVELVKFQQASLDNALLIGVDCLGTYSVTDYQTADDKDALTNHLLAAAPTADLTPFECLSFRSACQICEHPLPTGDHLALAFGLLGVEPGKLYVRARQDLADTLNFDGTGTPPNRDRTTQQLISTRTQARDEAFAQFRSRVHSMESLLQEFSPCIRCHNCMINCPICYCRECIFRTPTFEHESQLFFQWAERKGTVRMLPDTLLFHLTRLNHMVTSCVGCGLCTQTCPVDIPVGTVFRAVAQKAQALFDYLPGRSLDDAAPVQEFREDELSTLGERPH